MGEIDTLEAQHFFLEANHNVNFYFILVSLRMQKIEVIPFIFSIAQKVAKCLNKDNKIRVLQEYFNSYSICFGFVPY